MKNIQGIDPVWAWQPFEPTAQNPWNRRKAFHLYRRAGLGATVAQVEEAQKASPQQTVDRLMVARQEADDFEATADTLARTIVAGGDPKKLSAAWVYRFLFAPQQLLEKMTLFWHGHFATSAAKVQDARMMWNQNQLLRAGALGNFGPLVQSIAQDPAMLIYLDSTTNRKSHPNENFARELMELFCLGEGNYTEVDVQQLARCFTGWEIKNDKFRKNRYQQDRGDKLVLGQSGNFDGEDGVRIVLAQPAMPLFICRKLVQYLICDEPTLSDQLLQPLADTFREHDLEIAPVVRQVLGSNLFFSEFALARKIRSPVELVLGMLRSLQGTANTVLLAEGLAQIGQGLFFPPNVKGWDGGRAWINSSTLLGRTNLIQRILQDESLRFAGDPLETYLSRQGVESSLDVIRWLEEALLAVELSSSRREQLLQSLQSDPADRERQLRNAVHTLATLPEFQIG